MESSSPLPTVGHCDEQLQNLGSQHTAEVKESTAIIIPPYWQHIRHTSYASILSNGRLPPITLEDHTDEPEGQTSPLWAKVVAIDSHVIVSGNVPGVGDYVVWICSVDTLDVRPSCYCSPPCCGYRT